MIQLACELSLLNSFFLLLLVVYVLWLLIISLFPKCYHLLPWMRFNQFLSKVLSKSLIGYLSVIDGRPNEMDAMLIILE